MGYLMGLKSLNQLCLKTSCMLTTWYTIVELKIARASYYWHTIKLVPLVFTDCHKQFYWVFVTKLHQVLLQNSIDVASPLEQTRMNRVKVNRMERERGARSPWWLSSVCGLGRRPQPCERRAGGCPWRRWTRPWRRRPAWGNCITIRKKNRTTAQQHPDQVEPRVKATL